MKLMITGGRGFIGSAFVRSWAFDAVRGLSKVNSLVVFSRDSQAWTVSRLQTEEIRKCMDDGTLKFVHGDLLGDISGLCENQDAVVNFAAKTFVDHSIRDPQPFIEANTLGTARLLAEAHRQGVKTFIQISTDEVYGQILRGAYDERATWNPRNPYAAAKAGADALAISYAHTFGMKTLITRTENNYGPWQHPQKAIPVFIAKALKGEPIPVYGDGQHVRQWLHVSDHITAVNHLLQCADQVPGGSVWHVAGSQELTNETLARRILAACDADPDLIQFIDDHNVRPGHDRRYALDCGKMNSLGWHARVGLSEGLQKCVEWYRENAGWLAGI